MKINNIIKQLLLLTLLLGSCSKSEFLGEKPNSSLVLPKTLADLRALLDNTNRMNVTGSLAQLSSDEYVLSDANYNSETSATSRFAFIWDKDIYRGDVAIADWDNLYVQIFYANAVLAHLLKFEERQTEEGHYIRGWALFVRAYAFYDLTRNFCKAYDKTTASTDLGIPIRLEPAIDYVVQRSSLQQSYDRIIDDLAAAEQLLSAIRPSTNLNRPSKIAVYALRARIYLDMGDYVRAEANADKCLELYNVLIDYKTVDKSSVTPFSSTNDELIYNTRQFAIHSNFTGTFVSSKCRVSPELLGLYASNDLRVTAYFNRLTDNSYTVKRGYVGVGSYGFTGLATDELYLIKAECLARRNETVASMNILNQLVSKRWDANATVPARPYLDITANDPSEALQKVLLERRKELVWRGLRWHDLKRLNREGANISLKRTLNNVIHNLAPNDPRYVFPIPEDEIGLSGIEQNIR